MRRVVTSQRAGIRVAIESDRLAAIRGHDIEIEIDQSLAGRIGAIDSGPVGGVAGGATKSCIDVTGMLREASILHDVREIVALGAKRIGTVRAQVRRGKEIRDRSPRGRRSAEFVAAFQDVTPLGSMRPPRPRPAGLAIVVTIVAIGTLNLRAHRTPLRGAIQVPHVDQQARLR